MLGCTETITIVHHVKDDDDTYICHTVDSASWFSKTTITTSADGAKPVNSFDVRVLGDLKGFIPSLGDYCVKGIVKDIETPSNLKGLEYFRITSVGNNNRGSIPHWRLGGQ